MVVARWTSGQKLRVVGRKPINPDEFRAAFHTRADGLQTSANCSGAIVRQRTAIDNQIERSVERNILGEITTSKRDVCVIRKSLSDPLDHRALPSTPKYSTPRLEKKANVRAGTESQLENFTRSATGAP